MLESYRASGRMAPVGVPAMLLSGLAAALVSGVIYAYVIAWIPFIYVSCLATMAFGILLGVAVEKGARFGKVRNAGAAHLFGLIAGLAGLYVAWAWDGKARGGAEAGIPVLWDPQSLMDYTKVFYSEGFWGLDEKFHVSGILLGVVWAGEAFLILAAATIFGGISAADPFCESCDEWTVGNNDYKRLVPPDDPETLTQLEDGDVELLAGLDVCDADQPQSIRLGLDVCPACTDTRFLTVQLARQVVDDEGDVVERNTRVVTKGVLDTELLSKLRQVLDQVPPAEDSTDCDRPDAAAA